MWSRLTTRKLLSWGLLALIIVALAVFFMGYHPVKYPIEFTEKQNVLREPPVFHLDEPVDVEAVFANTTGSEVTFTAAIHWVLVTQAPDVLPEQVDIVQLGLLVTLKPGCTRMNFNNNPPGQVVDISKKLFAAGYQKATWRLTGSNVVIDPENSGQKQFDVEEFSYIPDSTPLPPTRQINITRCVK